MLRTDNIKRQWLPSLSAGMLALLISPGFAATTEEARFNSADEAVHALYTAVETNNQAAIERLIGPLGSSDDAIQDKADRERFVHKYSEMHRLVKEPDGTTVLYIGAENWPFPVPLVSSNGKWHFDVDAGSQEVMFRRVGRNETTAIETGRAIARDISHPDRAANSGEIGEFAQKVAKDSAAETLNGYEFRVLRTSNKPVVLACPSEYGSTGIMTFAVSTDGAVYEKDLGPKTADLAKTMATYKPDGTWHAVKE